MTILKVIQPKLRKARPVLNRDNALQEKIIKLIAETWNVSVEALQSRERTWDIMLPRTAYMFLMRSHTAKSLSQIGEIVHRDHATVLHAVKNGKLANQGYHPELKKYIDTLTHLLQK